MARKLKSDKVLFLATFLLVCASVVMVYSASAVLAMDRYQQPYLFLFKQVTWVVMGLFTLGLVMRVDYRHLKQPIVIWTMLGVSTLALIGVLFGPSINGTHRWFAVAGIGVQPSELAKLAVILFTAALLERRMDRIDEISFSVGPLAVVVGGISGLILLEPDFGTALALIMIVGVMIFVAGISYRYLFGFGLAVLPLFYMLVAGAEYRRRRLLSFLDPWSDPLGDGFQVIQSLIAVGTGGLVGRGLMGGVQKLFYLPEPHTDFIYAVIAEESGFIGATAVLICFCVIIWRGLRITLWAPDRFGVFLALGLTTMIGLQAFVNISVVLGLMPTKGIPLPFVSSGGSSLLIGLLSVGILLNISQHASTET